MPPNLPPAGWYADHERPGQERLWDGSRWTDRWRPAPPPPPAAGTRPPAAPAPPPAGRPRGGRTVLKIALGVVLGVVLLVAGCTALLAIGLNAEEDDGITRQEFASIALGTPRTDIEARFGPPESAQDFESRIPEIQARPTTSSCIYYPERGRPVLEGATFQLCFDGGNLTSKNAYG